MRATVISLPFGASVRVAWDLDEGVFRLQVAQDRLKNIRPLLVAIAQVMRRETRDRFSDAGEGRWQPLRPSTVASKAIAGLPARTSKGNVPLRLIQKGAFGPTNILIGSGALRDSYANKSNPNHIEVINERAGTVVIGSKLPYARMHQEGVDAFKIMAKAGKALAFTGSSGGMMFRKGVNHPGLPPRPIKISRAGVEEMKQVAARYLSGENVDSIGN